MLVLMQLMLFIKKIVLKLQSKEIANSVVEILKNIEEYKDMEINARKIIEEKYSWNGISLQYGELYENCINNR